MKGSPCCAGLMRSCLHTYRTKTNLTQHIIQPWGGEGGHQASMGGPSVKYGGSSAKYGGGPSVKYGGVINQLWGGAISQVWGGIYFPASMYRKSKSTELLEQHIRPAFCKQNGRTKQRICQYLHVTADSRGGDGVTRNSVRDFPTKHWMTLIVMSPWQKKASYCTHCIVDFP